MCACVSLGVCVFCCLCMCLCVYVCGLIRENVCKFEACIDAAVCMHVCVYACMRLRVCIFAQMHGFIYEFMHYVSMQVYTSVSMEFLHVVCACVNLYVYKYICIYILPYVRIIFSCCIVLLARMHTYTRTQTHRNTHTHTHTRAHAHARARTRTQTCRVTITHTHKHTHNHTHIFFFCTMCVHEIYIRSSDLVRACV